MLSLVYDEALDPQSVPPPDRYVVAVNGAAATLDTARPVSVSGNSVTLRLARATVIGDRVTVEYTAPTGTGATPVRDLAGNAALDFAAMSVQNRNGAAPPPAPTAFLAAAGDARVRLTWAEPAHDGGSDLSGYRIRHAAGAAVPDGTAWTDVGIMFETTVTGLGNGTAYAFEVQAVNGAGPGTPAARQAMPRAFACAAPDLSGRRTKWSARLVLGPIDERGQTVAYGYYPGMAGSLSATSFTLGANRYSIDAAYRAVAGADAGRLVFSLTSALAAADRTALRLHVCDTAFELSAAPAPDGSHNYKWMFSTTDDWSLIGTRMLRLTTGGNQAATGAPEIAGTAQVGQTLTASVGTVADPDRLPPNVSGYAWQWLRVDGATDTAIEGATGTSYRVAAADAGKTLKVRLRFTDREGGAEERVSAPTALVPADNTAPSVMSIARQSPASSPTNADSLTWRVTFSEEVENVDWTDFDLTGTTATLTVTPVALETGAYDVMASAGNLGSLTGPVTLSFASGQDIRDASGNALANTTPPVTNEASYEVDNTAPMVISIARASPASSPTNADVLVWQVTFSEAVAKVDAADFTVTGTTATLTVAAVDPSSPSQFDVTAEGGDLADLNATVTLAFASDHNIADLAGHELTTTAPTDTNDNTFKLDNMAPTVTITGVPQNSAAAFTATITFTEPVTGFVMADITLTNATASNFTGTDGDAEFTALITPTAEGAVTVDVAANVAQDDAGNGNTAAAQVSSTYSTGICPRTQQVRNAILNKIAGVTNCALVTDQHLAAITGGLNLNGQSISALAEGDFDGLTALTGLYLNNNSLAALPAGVFDGLTALTELHLNNNPLAALPAGVFDDLSALTDLRLDNNRLAALPAGVFDDLAALTRLVLNNNRLAALPAGVFGDLSALTSLHLNANRLAALPAGVFDGLSALTGLYLNHNGLAALPAGVFDDRTTLTELRLDNNSLAALSDGVFEDLTELTLLQLEENPGAPFAPTAVAVANPATVLSVGGTVTLAGSAPLSGNPWGANVTYDWALTNPATGVTVTFDDAMAATTTVTIPAQTAGTVLTFTLEVDGRASQQASQTATTTVTVTETPTVTLALSDASISENGGASTVTATVSPASATAFTVTAAAAAVSPAVAADFNLSTNTTLSFATNATTSTGTVTITSVDNAVDAADKTVTVSGTVSESGVTAPANLTLTLEDDDTRGVTVSDPTLAVNEGSTGVYTVALDSRPTESVTVTPSSDNGEVTVTGVLTFTTANWNMAQPVTVTAAQDSDAVDDSATISHVVAGGDYALVTATSVVVTVDDDETPDTTAPRVASIVRQTPPSSPTNADSLVWRVSFSETVSGVDAADFTVSGTTATVTTASAVTGVTGAYDVTASGGDLANLTGPVTLSFAGGQDIQDAANNALTDTAPTGANDNSYVLDNTAPTVTITDVPPPALRRSRRRSPSRRRSRGLRWALSRSAMPPPRTSWPRARRSIRR